MVTSKKRPALREIMRADDLAVGRAHALLRRTFHKVELVSVGEWRNSLREREAGLWSDIRWHLVIAESGGRVVGVTSGNYLGNVNTGVIGYLAVTPAARRGGVGPELRSALRGLFRTDASEVSHKSLQAIVGEVRRENPWLRTLVRRDKVLVLDFEYRQPRLRRGDHLLPLALYYESLDRIRTRLPTIVIRKLLYTIWRRVYRIPRPLSSPAFRRMLTQLNGRKSIGRLKLKDLPGKTPV